MINEFKIYNAISFGAKVKALDKVSAHILSIVL